MKIIGIGNALLDVLLRLDNDMTLSALEIKKGAMDLIDEAKMKKIQKAQSDLERSEAPGGSVSNTVRSLARLGADAGYIGKVGTDRAGEVYKEATVQAGVKPFFVSVEGVSGCSTVLISPDGERTMATFLGPAETLTDSDVADETLLAYDLLYIEGYLISNERLFLPVLKRAKSIGLKVALDLSNFNIVNAFRPMLQEVIPKYVDILFSNESEAEAYTGLTAREAINVIARDVERAIVTIGKDGVLVSDGAQVVHIAALPCNVIDTTGAGDNFAAGFLYGYSLDATLEQAASIGALLSSKVIEVVGAQIPDERWNEIKSKVKEIITL
ncbi:MAG: adenosine kinase [Tannerella sp.]|jgi:sugar/nucleoside kinase (ribokinase family)|nr:adenosine kinase [Tannerella sp.]